jgi:hypothetical protein
MSHRKACRALPRDFNHHQRCEVWEDNTKCPRRALFTASYKKRRVILCRAHRNALRDQLKNVVKEI